MQSKGDFIGGKFLDPTGDALVSVNPARDGAPVFETLWSLDRVEVAVQAAAEAQQSWRALSLDERWEILKRFRDALKAREKDIADAILWENGKIRSEATAEARSLASRFDLTKATIERDLKEGPVAGFPSEVMRYQAHGVVGVIGPYNFPLHLCNVHVAPALMLGNTVVMKPSSVTPLAGQRYAEAAEEAGLPPGIFNVVQGRGPIGSALIENPAVRGLCFTGSYGTGRSIQEKALDRPDLLCALEMGGKNAAVVLDDADLRQTVHETVIGGYLSAGQRCTCTERIFVQRGMVDKLIPALVDAVKSLNYGDPESSASFAGPLTTGRARDGFEKIIEHARSSGAEVLVEGGRIEGGFFAQPTLHRVPDGMGTMPGYTDTEIFGPDLSIQVFDTDEEGIELVNESLYGLANSVMTASRERYERFYERTRAGILNWNRSTNKASPRLPFGGVGMSGNYRPAGSHAARNVVIPVAIQENDYGVVEAHPMLVDYLPGANFESLEERHLEEERAELDDSLIDRPRPLTIKRPEGGHAPKSEAWLKRFYAGERMPREKKPVVFDHLRSSGPWMTSIDDAPISVLDGMSQTATLTSGFSADPVVRGYFEGAFEDTILSAPDTTVVPNEALAAYASYLKELMPELEHVTFANSGAEANEKALALCHLNRSNKDASKILAFQGSFHGRTLFALHATWNPIKREPFQIAGYEAVFSPYPNRSDDRSKEPETPAGFMEAVARGDLASLQASYADADDALLASEVAVLANVHEILGQRQVFVVNIEPMQSEGGDRYGSARFYRALRLLTRFHDVSLILDEVQTGYGLGGPFSWTSRFGFVDAEGNPDAPDAMVWAKRAQVGMVNSRFPDPAPTSVHPASLVRGLIHAQTVGDGSYAEYVEGLVKTRLEEIHRRYPELVGDPRGSGYAFAFDLPTPAHLGAYIPQRFWRGAVVFAAGTRTVRYRLSDAYGEAEIDLLFETIRRTLSWMDANPGLKPPAWTDFPKAERETKDVQWRVRCAESSEVDVMLPQILQLEADVYEPARRDPAEKLRVAFDLPDGVVVVAEAMVDEDWKLIGCALASPLDRFASVEGPDNDPLREDDETLYSSAITVRSEYQGLGIGRALKQEQLKRAEAMKRSDGSPRYRFSTGRNRVGHTAAMTRLNRIFGAHTVFDLKNQYGEADGRALYYRIPLGSWAPARGDDLVDDAPMLAFGDGVSRPLTQPPQSLKDLYKGGGLFGPTVNKLTLCNYVTPAVVRAVEWVSALSPRHPHLYLTSCRDETVDKSIRTLRYYRKEAQVVIGLEGGYLGHTTAAARSISDPAVQSQGEAIFKWPRIPHPETAGEEASMDALRKAVDDAGGPDQVLGLFVEAVQERTGRVISDDFWAALDAYRAETGLPIVVVETASASYRSQDAPFASVDAGFHPDIITWWGGGQVGFIHLDPRWYVKKPLTMVSTWDGDELSMMRVHHHLRAARKIDRVEAVQNLKPVLDVATELGCAVRGKGLYRVLEVGRDTLEVASKLAGEGLQVQALPNQCIAIVPPLDLTLDDAERAAKALRTVLGA